MSAAVALAWAVIVLALAFDFTNGFHDAANAIATAVSTRALSPRVALAMSAVLNLVGALLGQQVAMTIASGIVTPAAGVAGLRLVIAGLVGAIAWNLATWVLGLPSSSSHALIGGLTGAGLAAGATVHWSGIVDKVLLPMVISPVVGFTVAGALMLGILWAFRHRNAHRTFRGFRRAQVVSAAAMSLGHGLQDAQKTMGVIALALVSAGLHRGPEIPTWVVVASGTTIALGTWSGGWRVIRTLGRRVIELDPARGFAAETVGASVLYLTAFAFRAPVSTTHVITSAILGVGATRRLSAVRWGVARDIATAWVLTLPMAALAAAGFYELSLLVTG